jgi:hypothetical protein
MRANPPEPPNLRKVIRLVLLGLVLSFVRALLLGAALGFGLFGICALIAGRHIPLVAAMEPAMGFILMLWVLCNFVWCTQVVTKYQDIKKAHRAIKALTAFSSKESA